MSTPAEKPLKNSTGYNLAGMILGSEGTLGIITRIYLRLIPAPAITKDLLVPFDSLEQAIDAVTRILESRIVPAAIEFMEENAIQLVSKHLERNIAFPEAGAHLLIQLDGDSEETIFSGLEAVAKALQVDHENIFVAETSTQQERLWRARRSIREALSVESPVFLAEDCVVPRSRIPEFLKSLKIYLAGQNLDSVMFGHAGDGNVHIDILKGAMDYDTWKQMLPGLKKEIYRRAIALGGTITGEHGIGYLRKDYLQMALNPAEIELSKKIKSVFDPNSILNPGKIF